MEAVREESAPPQNEAAPVAKTKIFVSYSRRDAEFVEALINALSDQGDIHVFRDTEDILPTEEWKQRLANLIAAADTIVFCLSEHSAVSKVCAWEVAHAEALNKRIAPIVLQDVDGPVPSGLEKHNFIYFTDPDTFDRSVTVLLDALATDIPWIREHTRIGELARQWQDRKRNDQLLRGTELHDAEQWRKYRPAKAPEPSGDIEAFLTASCKWENTSRRRARLVQMFFVIFILVIGVGWWQRQLIERSIYWVTNVRPYLLSLDAEAVLKAKASFKECLHCPEMTVIPAGEFAMGSAAGKGNDNERPQRKVAIAQRFAVSKFEITFDQWDHCVAQGGCGQAVDNDWGRGRRPVINVHWDDAKMYVAWLSQLTGQTYRLLTEAEWEYAARAGTRTEFTYGDRLTQTKLANCNPCGSKWDGRQTAPVGSFKPNAFGLYDVHGNVSEWVEDLWHKSYEGAPSDGSAWIKNGELAVRVVRGGSWLNGPLATRSAYRFGFVRNLRNLQFGFRVARELRPAGTPLAGRS